LIYQLSYLILLLY